IKRMEETRPDGVVDCVTECPLTHFDDNNVCKKCSSFCKDVSNEGKRTCSGPASTDCGTCKYQYEGRCVEGCRPGQKAVKADNNNTFTCRKCRPGHECKLGDEQEDICPAGTASNDNRTMCVPCAAGEFSSAPGAASCQKCPAGQYSSPAGSNGCKDCPVGQYGNAAESTGCKICPAGQYSDTARSTGCKDCPAGKYSDATKSTGCKNCPAGQYNSRTGSNRCWDCPAGQYMTRAGSATCWDCPAGRYSNRVRSTTCTPCPAGQYSSGTRSTGCTNCPGGIFTSTAGSQRCTACRYGGTSNAAGRPACQGSTRLSSRVCEDETMSLSCNYGLEIQVHYAMYGRKNGSTCKKGWLLTHDCASSNSLSKVREYCQGRRTCSIQASNSVFGEPCFGTAKYLEATYTCIGTP
ncbi:PREDICTED: L-rhamnose-binding lectin CSL1-like, partial [Branchiostoma belcheri]|uniref:L-rhamnose-binding lectin CSL1-like n=1 Tax=Branchiostoma belcheri TaxID=7741 RepID=A0A6P4ZSU1_BRABE